ncbi:hypothetical protein V8J88_23775 [Massilia sp. W12]|uniref:hypothetical protein n=1 Tax=Massilia sp. W12 TaxID=3126507 RepID=UPI0030CBFDF6
MVILSAAGSAQAALYNLHFSGTLNTYGQTIHGVSGDAVPYQFEVTLDSSAAEPVKLAAGQHTPYIRTETDWYGYSAAHVKSVNILFGDKRYLMSELDYNPRRNVSISQLWNAPIWLDGRVEQGARNGAMQFTTWNWDNYDFSWINLGRETLDQDGVLRLNSHVHMRQFWSVGEWMYNPADSVNSQFSSAPVPETEQYLMMAGGIALLGWRLRRRKTA